MVLNNMIDYSDMSVSKSMNDYHKEVSILYHAFDAGKFTKRELDIELWNLMLNYGVTEDDYQDWLNKKK